MIGKALGGGGDALEAVTIPVPQPPLDIKESSLGGKQGMVASSSPLEKLQAEGISSPTSNPEEQSTVILEQRSVTLISDPESAAPEVLGNGKGILDTKPPGPS